MASTDRVHHACTVNGHDAQYWWEMLQEVKRIQGAAYMRGIEQENRRWEQATGHTLRWFLDRGPDAGMETPEAGHGA